MLKKLNKNKFIIIKIIYFNQEPMNYLNMFCWAIFCNYSLSEEKLNIIKLLKKLSIAILHRRKMNLLSRIKLFYIHKHA